MYIMTREKQEIDTVKCIPIENPRFDIDEVRRIKAFIRFNVRSCVQNADVVMHHDLDTIFKFGRCTSISTIGGALYRLCIRVAGKEQDTEYILQPKYVSGGIFLTVVSVLSVAK